MGGFCRWRLPLTCASCGLATTQTIEVLAWSIEHGYGPSLDFCSWSCLKDYCEWRRPELKLEDVPRRVKV